MMASKIVSSPILLDDSTIPKVSVATYLLNRLKEHGNRKLFLDCPSERVWTATHIAEKATNLAAALIEQFDLISGDIVLFYVPNSDYFAISILGVFICGAIFTGISEKSTYRELMNAIIEFDVSYVVCCRSNYEIAIKAVNEVTAIKKLFIIDDDINLNLENCEQLCKWFGYERKQTELQLPVHRHHSEMATFLLSSGSTGKPKAAIKTNFNLIYLALVLQDEDCFGQKNSDITITTPFIHISGLSLYLHCIVGGTQLAIMREKLNVDDFCQYVQKYRITSAFVVPTFLYLLADKRILDKYDLSSLTDIMHGGSSMSIAKLDTIKGLFPNMRPLLRSIYGMTEVGWATKTYKSELNCASLSSVGKPVPGGSIKIIDHESGQLLGQYEVGEVCIKNSSVSPGYYKLPEITRESFDSDGFIKSGDAGYYDDCHNLFIVGRYKEIIKVSGSQVSLAELENILCSHEAVKEVSVISLPHDIKGEIPKAFVVLKDGYDHITEDSIHSFLNERVVPFKQLFGGVEFMKELPKLPLGKIDKKVLTNTALNLYH